MVNYVQKWQFGAHIRRLLLILFAVYIGFVSKISVQAEGALDMRQGFYWAMTMDSEGEAVFLSPAIVAQSYGEDWDWTDIEIITGEYPAEEKVTELFAESDRYELEYEGTDTIINDNGKEFVYAGWTLEDEPIDASDINVLSLADSIHQGEKVTFYGRSWEDDTAGAIYTKEVVLTELNSSSYDFLSIDNYPEEEIMYPAMLVNEKDELVAVVFGREAIVGTVADTSEFYSEVSAESDSESESSEEVEPSVPDSSPEEEQQSSPEPEAPSEPTEPDISQTELGNVAAPLNFEDEPDSGEGSGLIAGIVIACVVIAAVIAIILVVVKKKKTKTAADISSISNEPDNYQPVDDIGPTVPMDAEAAPISPIGQQEPNFWVVARGGYMDGRVYPMRRDEITIGRNSASVIRYPDDTAGVSRVHAKLYWQSGKLMLMDCNSTSGTFLKRLGKMMPMVPLEVQHGDIFYIGEKKNSFEIRNGGN